MCVRLNKVLVLVLLVGVYFGVIRIIVFFGSEKIMIMFELEGP